MKRPILTLILALSTFSFGQDLDFIANIGQNRFFQKDYEGDNTELSFTPGMSSGLKLGLSNVIKDAPGIRFELGVTSYSGQFIYDVLDKAYSHYTFGELNLTTFDISVYPVNFKFWKNFDFNLGLTGSVNIVESFSGIDRHIGPNSDLTAVETTQSQLNEKYNSIARTTHFGITSRLAYSIPLKGAWFIQPQVNYYLGVSSEIEIAPSKMKSMRGYIGVGIRRSLNFKEN